MNQQRIPRRTREEWEDWEDSDAEPLTPQRPRDGPSSSGAGRSAPRSQRTSMSSSTTTGDRIRRLKSRQRQKAQNAQAGIKLVTDMSRFREQRQSRTGKFVDAAALKALEGSNSAEPAGGFNWRKKKAGQQAKGKMPDRLGVDTPVQEDLSPSAGPIMIGFAMPSDSEVIVSPQTVTVETPMDFSQYFGKPAGTTVPTQQPVSAWSPDTPDSHSRPSIIGEAMRSHVPAVPSVPMAYRGTQPSAATEDDAGYKIQKTPRSKRETRGTVILLSDDESDASTPITLFEEDGNSPLGTQRRSVRPKGRNRSSTAASLRSTGWWDQVTTPFAKTPDTPLDAAGKEAKDWWSNTDRKQPQVQAKVQPQAEVKVQPQAQAKVQPQPQPQPRVLAQGPAPTQDRKIDYPKAQVGYEIDYLGDSRSPASINRPPRIIVEAASPPPPISPQPSLMPSPRGLGQRRARTSPAPAEHEESSHPTESPPPYSPPPAQTNMKENVRYRAVFPPNHPLNAMYPPSPGPLSPGLSRTMTSQGAIGLTNIPLTPATTEPVMVHTARLPDRPMGSFVPQTTFDPPPGSGPRQKAERQRRRHEKEDSTAYKAGGLWRGRACIPEAGCFGRPGREGRKRRRVWLLVCGIMLVLVTLAVVLPLTLLRRGAAAAPPSLFLNLTTFPPMPTGVLTIVGADADATTNCVTPPTLWSCALPKEQAALAAPYDNSHPTFILNIQFDNDTRQLWDVLDGVPPVAPSRRLRRQRPPPTNGFTPSPAPPPFQELFFLGDTTDGVVSPLKAGEPTPFYLSVLQTLPASPTLTRRQTTNFSSLVPPPRLDPQDGTSGAPAVLLPFPEQQPLRLYDRGLPTERYAFYTYYDKSTYLKSILPLDKTGASNPGPVPADLDGGALRSEANFVVTWLQARYKVEIWTRRGGSARLLSDATPGGARPGTFPFPVTVTLDTHGGELGKKFGFVRPVDERGRIVEGEEGTKFVGNDLDTKGDVVNPVNRFREGFGGMDGGTGGCKCEFRNFVGVNGG